MRKSNSINQFVSNKWTDLRSHLLETIENPTKRRLAVQGISKILVSIFKYIILFGLCFIILYPLIQQIAIAFRAPKDINDPSVVWVPKEFSIENFRIAIVALDYRNALQNTILVSLGTTILQVIVTSLTGYAFARLKFPGRNILFSLVLLTIIVPPTTLTIPTLLFYKDAGMLGRPISLFLMSGLGMGIKSGIFIFIFRQFFGSIPIELEEAALVDGAGPFRIFTRVMMPNARGAIITVALFAFVWQWNDSYYSGLFISGANVEFPILSHKLSSLVWGLQNTLFSLGVWDLIGEDITKNPLFLSLILNTAAILVMLPLLILYFFVQRYFVEGVERTGIVG